MLALFLTRVKIFFLVIVTCSLYTPAVYAIQSPDEFDAHTVDVLIASFQTANDLKITATPEVIFQINHLRLDEQARAYFHLGLEKMQANKATIENALKIHSMPADLIAIPLVESGYENDLIGTNTHNTGIWQLSPDLARSLGLVVIHRDDRMNISLATLAALNYLQTLYAHYKDWQLAILAYHYGQPAIDMYLRKSGARDAWTLVRSPVVPGDLKNYLANFEASVIIMHNPALVASS